MTRTTQPSLFESPTEAGKRARRSDVGTSKAAAVSSLRFSESHENRILAALDDGDGTIYEIGARAELDHVAVARRMKKLQELGHVKRTGETRETPAGGRACVWANTAEEEIP